MRSTLLSKLAVLALASTSIATDVLDLNKDTFDKAVTAPLTLVEFYAPW